MSVAPFEPLERIAGRSILISCLLFLVMQQKGCNPTSSYSLVVLLTCQNAERLERFNLQSSFHQMWR